MKSFHNDPAIKEKYLARVLAHQKADEITKGTYYEKDTNGRYRVCAVGCTIHSRNHNAYEKELGIPMWLAFLEDRLFEGMPIENAKSWPYEFLEAIAVGVDLDQIKKPFLVFVLESTLERFDYKKFPDCHTAVTGVINLLKDPSATDEQFLEARRLARTVAAVAYVAGVAGAAAAVAGVAAGVAGAAAVAYADAAGAAYVAGAAAAAYAAVVQSDQFLKFSRQLLKLIRECK